MNKATLRRSVQLYGILLRCYPKTYRQEYGKEMLYVFSESIKDVYRERSNQNIITFWGRTLLDAITSIYTQYREVKKGGENMKNKKTDIIMQNKVFVWIAIVTGVLLLIPFMLMQVSSDWNWDHTDFIVIGALIFGIASVCVLTARKIRQKSHRIAVAIAFLLLLLYIYAELAVGIFTNFGS